MGVRTRDSPVCPGTSVLQWLIHVSGSAWFQLLLMVLLIACWTFILRAAVSNVFLFLRILFCRNVCLLPKSLNKFFPLNSELCLTSTPANTHRHDLSLTQLRFEFEMNAVGGPTSEIKKIKSCRGYLEVELNVSGNRNCLGFEL